MSMDCLHLLIPDSLILCLLKSDPTHKVLAETWLMLDVSHGWEDGSLVGKPNRGFVSCGAERDFRLSSLLFGV